MLTPVGELWLSASRSGLQRVCWDPIEHGAQSSDPVGHLDSAQAWFKEYFEGVEGRRPPFDLVSLTAFQTRILNSLLESTSFGMTTTYGALARIAGSPRAPRAVGSVMAHQPMPIIIPCHRVLPSSGDVGRYSGGGGALTKTWLLEHERG